MSSTCSTRTRRRASTPTRARCSAARSPSFRHWSRGWACGSRSEGDALRCSSPAPSFAVALTMAVVFSAGAGDVCAQSLQVGIIDFYGLHRVTEAQARAALTVKEGDIVPIVDEMPPAFVVESERRLSALAGVRQAYLNVTCCDAGRGIVYVGLEE